jgi:hypothetical protein
MKNAASDSGVVALSSSANSDLDHRVLSEPAPLAQASTKPSLKRETFSTSRLLAHPLGFDSLGFSTSAARFLPWVFAWVSLLGFSPSGFSALGFQALGFCL